MFIGNVELKNRFLMSPVKTGYGDAEGNISERHLAFWDVRTKHVSAVIFEPFFIDKRVRELPTQIGIDTDDKIDGHKRLVQTVHRNASKAIAHINHPGRMANPKLPGNIYLSASAVACPNGGQTPVAMSFDDIAKVQNQYIQAAIRAEKAGYDFIELQFGLGYLIAQFLSPITNKRDDEYGGSFENRMRFGIEIFQGIKNTVQLPIIVRISGDEKVEGGLTLLDALEIAQMLESEGAAAIHVTTGNACESAAWYYQHHFIPKGASWKLAQSIKEKTSLPVIVVGQITEKEDVNEVLNGNYADYIALGRALITDPDFVGKYLNVKTEEIRPCSSCLTGCLGRIKIGKGLQCEINPEVGRELEPLVPAENKKTFAVVGGGMSGMQAAITLKKRGHSVTLFEKKELGGQFNLAPLPSQKNSLRKQIDYLIGELQGVTIVAKEAEAGDLIGKFDSVVIASGSKPFVPPIDGLKEYSWAEILYQTNLPNNKNVLIIGGGLIGVEVANTLIDHNNQVTIVEMLDEIARNMEMVSKKLNLQKLSKNGVPIYTNTKVAKIDGQSVFLENTITSETMHLSGFDIIVIATGMRPNKELIGAIEGAIPYHVVGDADKVGDVVTAIQSAYFTCKEL